MINNIKWNVEGTVINDRVVNNLEIRSCIKNNKYSIRKLMRTSSILFFVGTLRGLFYTYWKWNKVFPCCLIQDKISRYCYNLMYLFQSNLCCVMLWNNRPWKVKVWIKLFSLVCFRGIILGFFTLTKLSLEL